MINILGMTVTMDRVNKVAIIKQKHFMDKVASTFSISKKAVTPAYGDLMKEENNGELLKDQKSGSITSVQCTYWSRVLVHSFIHIKVRYFWVKELVADLLTKAVTGAKFKYLRAKLHGWNDEDMDKEA